MKRKTTLIAATLLALSFGVGGLVGMAVEEAYGIDWFEFLDVDPDPGQAILADLSLTEKQKAAIEDIFEQQEDNLEDYWEGRLPELKTIVEKTDDQIRQVLTPEQRAVFDQRIGKRGTSPGLMTGPDSARERGGL